MLSIGRALSAWICRVSKGWVALAALIFFIGFTALILPRQAEQAEQVSGGAGAPDTSFFYSVEALYAMAEAYGPAGRAAYIRARFTFDVVWPWVYTLFLCTAISWLYKQASGCPYTNLAPLLGTAFDYLENLAAVVVMWRYPKPTPVIAHSAPIFTALKWVFIGVSFGFVLVGASLRLWHRYQEIRRRK